MLLFLFILSRVTFLPGEPGTRGRVQPRGNASKVHKAIDEIQENEKQENQLELQNIKQLLSLIRIYR